MRKPTSTAEFLTRTENLIPVLEILRHAEDVRAKALSLFWTRLAKQLRDNVPASLAKERLLWEVPARPTEAFEQYAGINLHVGGSESQSLELHFRIEQENLPKVFKLYFGLHWKKEVDESSATAKIKKVMLLRLSQANNDFVFDNSLWWWGWKYIREEMTCDDFLLEFAQSPEMTMEVAAMFLSYVEQTSGQLVQANKAIGRKRSAKS